MEEMSGKKKQTVTVRGLTLGEGRTKICVPLVARGRQELGAALESLRGVPFDFAEFRADYYEGIERADEGREVLERIRAVLGEQPLLFTYRTAGEGGEGRLSFEGWQELNLWAADTCREGLVDLVDLELFTAGDGAAALTRRVQQAGAKVVGSSHDFGGTPEVSEMVGRLTAMQEAGMDIVKLAVMPRSRLDVVRLLVAAVLMEETYGDRPCVTMSMGKTGGTSRILGSLTGSAFTFASAGRTSAPGQMAAADVRRILDILEEERT